MAGVIATRWRGANVSDNHDSDQSKEANSGAFDTKVGLCKVDGRKTLGKPTTPISLLPPTPVLGLFQNEKAPTNRPGLEGLTQILAPITIRASSRMPDG
jgi:hypothetical protein